MSNVFPLFTQATIESVADPRTQVTTAVTEIMASNAQLERRIKELLIHLDAIDLVIEALGEAGSHENFLQFSKNNRAALIRASRELSEHVKMLPALRNDFVDALSDELSCVSGNRNFIVSGVKNTEDVHRQIAEVNAPRPGLSNSSDLTS